METKTDKVRKLVGAGQWKAALSILRQFHLGFTKEQKRLIQISSDVLNGHGNFYDSLGIDTSLVLNECKSLILSKYKM